MTGFNWKNILTTAISRMRLIGMGGILFLSLMVLALAPFGKPLQAAEPLADTPLLPL